MANPTTWKEMAFCLRGLAGTCNTETKGELLALAKACDELAGDLERLPSHRNRTSVAATS
jgi:hypothetical protein